MCTLVSLSYHERISYIARHTTVLSVLNRDERMSQCRDGK